MWNTNYNLVRSFLDFEIHSVEQENSQADPLSKKVTSVATEILEMAHGLKEYGRLYKNKELMDRFKNGNNIDNLALAKIQRRFTTLKGRVEKLKDVDPRIEGIFKKMVKVGIDDSSKRGGLESLNQDVLSLIGKKNIIDSGPFSKHGIICVKDSAMPDPRPVNLVSKTELKEMNLLRKKMYDPKAGVFNIKGSSEFVSKTKWNLEKLLTIEVGRQLLTELCNYKNKLTLCAGEKDMAIFVSNEVTLTNKKFIAIGYENGLNISVATPSWIATGHELIHMLHHYSRRIANNRNNQNIDKNLWTDGEEYETIGDPTKDINPISENGLRKNSLHPLRIYHHFGNSENNLEQAVNKFIYSNINGELIELLNNKDLTYQQIKQIVFHCCVRWNLKLAENLLSHPTGKDIVKDNFQRFYEGAESNNDQICIEKMRSDFLIEYYAYKNKDVELSQWYISQLMSKLKSEWDSDLVRQLLHHKNIRFGSVINDIFEIAIKNLQNTQSVLGELIRRVTPHRLIFSMYVTTGLGENFKTNYSAILEDRKDEVIKYLNGPNNIAPKMQLAIKNFFNIQEEVKGTLLNT